MAKPGVVLGGALKTILAGVQQDGAQQFFLTPEQQQHIATRLNAVINLPIIGEIAEQAIFLKIVQAFDRNTFKFIPKEILQVAMSGGKPLPEEIRNALREKLPAILLQAVPLPFLHGPIAQALISTFVSILLQALGSGKAIGAPSG
jgi:hypothetical protein